MQPIRRVAAWLSPPALAAPCPLGRWQDVVGGAHSNPSCQGAGPGGSSCPRPEGDASPRTLPRSRELGRFGGQMLIPTQDGRVCSKQPIPSHRQAAAALLFLFKTLLSTSWNIGPEYRGV